MPGYSTIGFLADAYLVCRILLGREIQVFRYETYIRKKTRSRSCTLLPCRPLVIVPVALLWIHFARAAISDLRKNWFQTFREVIGPENNSNTCNYLLID